MFTSLRSLLLLFLPALAVAQSVRWELAEQSTQATAVQLVFENCAPDNEPTLPAIPNATLQLAGTSQNTNVVNFQVTRSVLLIYLVQRRGSAPVQIPAFEVATNKGRLKVDAFTIPAPQTSVDSIAGSKLIPGQTTMWAGEVFSLAYELSASRRNNPQINPTFDWNAAPLVAEDWSKYEFSERVVNGERRAVVTFRTRAIAKNPGPLKLEAASHLLTIQTGTIASWFGPQARNEQISVTSDQPVIEVRPLPAKPSGFAAFNGAVGDFKLTSKVVPEKAAIGEPVTWTLELTGTGNWPDIPSLPVRNVSNDFRVVQPKAKRTPAEGKLFDATLAEDVVLVPTKPGTYTLGPIDFVYFDPKSGTYRKQSVAATTLTIESPATPQFNITPQPAAGASTQNPELKTQNQPPKAPPPPAAIPRDPLPGNAEVAAPLTATALVAWLVSPFVALLGLWFWLAVRRARQTDPVRPRREAHARLAKTLSHLQTATDADRAPLLLAWQRDTRTLWQISHAAPSATALPDPAWSALWAESERALYGSRSALPPDWIARAQEAHAAKRLPGFKPLRLFLPQNLMPFAALLLCAFFLNLTLTAQSTQSPEPKTPSSAAVDGAAAYRKADFPAAEKSWRAAVAKTPTNWIARHNLSLALAQQDRAAESAAHAAVAFVQQPSHPSTRWHFTQAAERNGYAARELAAFFKPGPRQSLAGLASPAQWQRLLIVCAWIAALALGWLLFNAYGPRRPLARGTSLALLLVAVSGLGAGTTSLVTFGATAHPSAVLVARATTLRSIPTEVDTPQKTTPLAPGSLAIADRTFLADRWLRLSFENGQTGWVRKDDVVPFWK